MKPETKQLLATLKVLSKGLSLRSEGDEAFKTFVCEATDRKNFTITNYRQKLNRFMDIYLSDRIEYIINSKNL
jgi:uncharacterized protein YpmS